MIAGGFRDGERGQTIATHVKVVPAVSHFGFATVITEDHAQTGRAAFECAHLMNNWKAVRLQSTQEPAERDTGDL